MNMKKICPAAALLAAVVLATTALALPHQQPVDPLPPLPTPAGPLPPAPVPAPVAPEHVLKVGDTMQVEGGTLGCQVTRRAGRVGIECRPAGALRGSYGTFLTSRTATVARFRSSRTAQVVFTARHKGGWRACGKPSRASAAAAGACR